VSALAGLLALAAYLAAWAGIRLLRTKGPEERFASADGDVVVTTPQRTPLPRRIFGALGRRGVPLAEMTLRSERARRKARRRIDASGRPYGISTLEDYKQRKGGLMLIGGGLALLLLLEGSFLPMLAALAVGFMWIDVLLDGAARRRQGRIDRDLPDFLDVLSVCISAGIAFRPAMLRVSEAVGGPVGAEVETALRQISLGVSRREAFEALRERNPSEPLGLFVSSFLQAEELGVALADALTSLARDMRRDAAQRARRRAQNTVPRISLVVIVTILPAALLLIVASLLLSADFSVVGG
jgi:tight adherence protein C